MQPPLVLVAEDQPGVRLLVQEVLQREGYRVVLAAHGRAALATAAAELPALALLDLRMPVLDGLETLRALKELAPDLPVLMMTAAGEEDGVAAALAAGAAGCIRKPFDVQALRRWAAQLLGEGRVRDGSLLAGPDVSP